MTPLETRFSQSMIDLGPFETAPHVAVAVSGGSDSMALALLAQRWAHAIGGRITALIVDHGIRKESHCEARTVQSWLGEKGIDSDILRLTFDASGAVQESARHARYHALTAWCQRHHVLHLLLGHHSQDQAETFLMRLLHHSGFDGLAAMSPCRISQGVRLLRPLLRENKPDLQQWLVEQGQIWVEDPSNESQEYERVRLRKFLHSKSETTPRLAKIAAKFSAYRMAEETRQAQWLLSLISVTDLGALHLSETVFSRLNRPDAMKLLHSALRLMQATDAPIRFTKLEALCQAMHTEKVMTMAGCLLMKQANGWLVCREPHRVASAQTLVKGWQQWDRFEFYWPNKIADYSVGAMTEEERIMLKDAPQMAAIPHPRLALTLPVIRHLEEVVVVPHIDFYDAQHAKQRLSIAFAPAKPLGNWPYFVMNGYSQS